MPFRRKFLARAGLLVGLILLVIGLSASLLIKHRGRAELKRARLSFSQRIGPVELSHYFVTELPGIEEAARLFELGAAAVVLDQDSRHLLNSAGRVSPASWTPEQKQRLESLLKHNQSAMDLMHSPIEWPPKRSNQQWNIRDANPENVRIPDLGALRTASGLLTAECWLNWERGNWDKSRESLVALSRLITALEGLNMEVSVLAGEEMEQDLHGLIISMLGTRDQVDKQVLGDLQATVPKVDMVAQTRRMLTIGSVLTAHLIEQYPERLARMGTEPGSLTRFRNQLVFRFFPEYAVAELLRNAETRIPMVSLPVASNMGQFRFPWDRREFRRVGPWEFVSPHFSSQIVLAQITAAMRQLTLTALQLRAIRAATGKYPSGRSGVKPLLEKDPLTGRLLRYERRGDGSVLVAIDVAPAERRVFAPWSRRIEQTSLILP